MDDWDNRFDKAEIGRDHARREEPALQEYDWARGQRQDRTPIEIINAILAELDDEDEDDALPQ